MKPGEPPRRKGPLKRGEVQLRRSELKRGKPPAPESPRRHAERPARTSVIEAVRERDGWRCRAEGLVPSVRCRGRLDTHEVIPRSAYPGAHLDERDCILVCRAHHEWIGTHKKAAARLALHGYSWQVGIIEAVSDFLARARLCDECSDPLGLDLCVDHLSAQAHPECCPFCDPPEVPMATELITEELQAAIDADRVDRPHRLAINWCGLHDCRLGTCFPLHYPEAFDGFDPSPGEPAHGTEQSDDGPT